MTTRPGSTQRSAQDVISMFSELNLPVCDDRAAIEKSFNERKPLYLTWTKNPDPHRNRLGKDGIKNGTELLQQLPDLLEVVYRSFAGWSDTTLSAAWAGGTTVMTKELSQNLRNTGLVDICRVCEPLADLWVERYMKEKGIEIGGDLNFAAQIEGFKVVTQPGSILLSWKWPAERCDYVQVTRFSDEGKRSKDEVIYEGDDTSFSDGSVIPGLTYEYRARAAYGPGFGPVSVVTVTSLPPAQIEGFKAIPQPGSIHLSWKYPSERCDFVEISRRSETGKKKKVKDEVIYKGQDVSYTDGSVEPGEWVEYHARAGYGPSFGPASVVRAVCLAEVSSLEASWQKNAMTLRWEKPSGEANVAVFRRKGEVPDIQSGLEQPAALSPDTELVYSGPGTSLKDADLVEGETYHYTVVTSFDKGIYSQGVAVQAVVPKPPPPPVFLKADYLQEDEAHAVVLNWQPIPGDQAFDYLVVRNDGGARPGSPQDGQLLKELSESTYADRTVKPGSRYTYAVFSRLGDLVSREGASAAPLDILAEVAGLSAQSGSQTIELAWREPPNASEVRIFRLQPGKPGSGEVQLRQTSRGYLRDEGLDNGVEYQYRVCCVFTIAGKPVCSPGLLVKAIPEILPEPAVDLQVRVEGLALISEWTPPGHGDIVVVRTAYPPEFTLHQRIKAPDVDRLAGEKIHIEGSQAIDHAPTLEKPYYCFFSVAGQHAIYCGVLAGVLIQDVRDLRLSVSSDGVFLRWSWPPGCTTVRIVRTEGLPPTGIDDQQAVSTVYSRWEYSQAGDKYFDKIEGHSGRFYYKVFAQVSSNAGQFFSPGTNPGCLVEVEWRPWMMLRYQVVPVAAGAQKGKAITLKWNVLDPASGFAGFVLVASQSAIPASPDDGIRLFQWKPPAEIQPGNYQEEISLSPVQDRRWAHFFLKLFCTDSAQRHFTQIWHPNYSLWYLPDGVQSGASLVEPARQGKAAKAASEVGYQAGIPDAVICPYCFSSFPPEEMLFTSYAGGTPVKAKYSFLDRKLRKPIPPPTDPQGRRLTVKLCPVDTSHILPYTAGLQSSLIIGMIGAKKSGKSHYIATLIDRLQNQVGGDMHAALLEVTEETAQRYRMEFFEPLFKSRLELPLTVGTPPPLIYDLTMDGSLWGEKQNRAVTLAFYDTAGENLQDPIIARQMVQYLSKASGVIFLVDPLQSTAIRQALPESVMPPEADTDASPNRIIANVLQLLEEGRVLDANAPISIPVALVMNKCDVLVDAAMIETNRLWSSEFRHVGSFDPLAHEDMNGMMAEYFQRWNPDAYNNIRLRFARHAFFGASATGCASDAVTRRYRFISPWRVEDPLLWLLSELNVIPKRE